MNVLPDFRCPDNIPFGIAPIYETIIGAVSAAAQLTLVREKTMVSAVVLLKIERNQINRVAEELAEIDGISEVFSVAGQYDLVAILRVANNQTLAELVTAKMLQVEGISDSETLIAFKVFSRHDLESMFEIGFEDK
jgi:DNA-binding Lrp family transcriptional regulator